MDIGPPFVANFRPTIAIEPGQRPLHRPTIATQALTGIDPASRNTRGDSSPAQGLSTAREVIALVGVQLAGRFRGRPRGRFMGSMASTVASSILESWTFAADGVIASGTPFRSTTTWRFEPDLPRSVGFGPVSAASRGGYTRRIQRRPRPVDLVRLPKPVEQHLVYLVPYACSLPIPQAAPTGHAAAAAHLLGKHLPGDAAAEHEHDSGQRCPIVQPRSPALGLGRLRWQQRLDDCP